MADWFVKQTLGALLDEADRRFGPREALYHEGRRWTFRELRQDVDQCARALMAAGVGRGEKITLWMPNRPEWIHVMLAAAKIGAVLVPINTRFRTADLEYVLWQSDTSTLITVDRSGPVDFLSMVQELCPEIDDGDTSNLRPEKFPELRRVIVLGASDYRGTRSWDDVMAGADEVPQRELEERHGSTDPDDTALMMYTSGTTGFPKGVMHNHNIQRTVVDTANRMGITPSDVTLMYLPLFHCFGLYEGPLMSLITGCRMALMTTFDPGECLKLIEQEKATVMHGFDTHFRDMMDHPDCENVDRSSLRTGILCAGMASSEPVARRAQSLLYSSVSGWGMTEVGVGATISFLDSSTEDRCTTSGYPLPGYEMKVVDPDSGSPTPNGSMGEMYVRGYGVMQGYYKKPEETAQAVDSDGWMHTGDCVIMRDDGVIRFLGRYKDQLKVGGENVDPAEVEQFLMDHPSALKVQVVGMPDDRLGEVVCACVVPRSGQPVDNDDLAEFCRGRLASFKAPRYTLIFDDYPMTSSGKVQKFLLKEMALERLGLTPDAPGNGV